MLGGLLRFCAGRRLREPGEQGDQDGVAVGVVDLLFWRKVVEHSLPNVGVVARLEIGRPVGRLMHDVVSPPVRSE
jgi:hypothetical protein